MEYNLALKRVRYYVSPATQVKVCCKELQQVENFKYLGNAVERIGNVNAVVRVFYISMAIVLNLGFAKIQGFTGRFPGVLDGS